MAPHLKDVSTEETACAEDYVDLLSALFHDRRLKNFVQEDVLKNLTENANASALFDEEFEELRNDREILRQIFPTGESRVCLVDIAFMLFVEKS